MGFLVDVPSRDPLATLNMAPFIGVVMAVTVLFMIPMPPASQTMDARAPWVGCWPCRSVPCERPVPSGLRVAASGEMSLDGVPLLPEALEAVLAAEATHEHHADQVALHIDGAASLEDAARAMALIERAGLKVVLDDEGAYGPTPEG